MFGMGMGEIILIAVVALLVLGPERLPSAAKALGKGIRDLRSQTKDLQQTIEKDTELGDAVRELRGALRGDPETLYERATGQRFSDTLKTPSSKPKISETSESSNGDEIAGALVDSLIPVTETNGESADDSAQGGIDSDPPAPESADSDSFEPVIRSAEGAVARGGATGTDDHG